MSVPVFVGTSRGREEWLQQFRASTGSRRIFVVGDEANWELGKIKWIFENTTYDRFLFLHDSIEVKDLRFFDLVDGSCGSVAICADPVPFGMFLGVYERKVLGKIPLWEPRSQFESVKAEVLWTCLYKRAADDVTVLFPDLADKNASEVSIKFGRPNLVLENRYLRKFKGTWGISPYALRNR